MAAEAHIHRLRDLVHWPVVLLLLSGCGASGGDAAQSTADAPAQVRVATPTPADFGERFTLTGTLTAERSAQLSPRVDGLVSTVRVDAGDRVRAGDVLVELDASVGRHALSRVRAERGQAEAAVTEAARLLEEGRRLGGQRFIAATEVATREAELRVAEAALGSARASEREQAELVERHSLPAPFDGVIAEKLAEAGEWVVRGTPVMSLVATDRVRLDVQAPQERFADIDGDTAIRVFPDALGDAALAARVQARVPVTDPGARTFLLRLVVDDPDGRLLPGTSARAELSLPLGDAALAVPRDALLRQPDGGYSLFVVVPGPGAADALVARRRTVAVLRDQGDEVAVGKGLKRGERVVVRGNEALSDGQPVRVVPD